MITPRYLLDSADPNARKMVIDDRSSKMEDIKESGSYIDDQLSNEFRDKSVKDADEIISSKSETL